VVGIKNGAKISPDNNNNEETSSKKGIENKAEYRIVTKEITTEIHLW
jgi:hypothetical protein